MHLWVEHGFNYDGTLDNSFDGDGIKLINAPNNYLCAAITTDQTSGKITVITSSVIFRLNPDGSTDTGFGVNGEITIAGANYNDAKTQADRKIIISGSLNGNVAIWRLNEINGSPDNTFGTNGLANINYAGEAAGGIEIQSDNQIIVNGNNEFMIKLHPDGNPNSNFGTNGITILSPDIQTGGIPVDRLVLQADNKIVLTAYQFSNNPAPDSTDFVFQKFDSTGVPDASCGNNGIVYTDFNDSIDFSYACAIQQDGKILIVGLDENELAYQIVRYLPSLSLGLLTLESNIAQAAVYPNPIEAQMQVLDYSVNTNGQLEISLLDQNGKLIQSFLNEYRSKGHHTEILNFDNSILPGNYLIQLSSSEGKQCIKIVKK